MAPLVTSPPSSTRGVHDSFDDEELAHAPPPPIIHSKHKQTPEATLPMSLASPRPAPLPPTSSSSSSASSSPTTSMAQLLPPPPLSPPISVPNLVFFGSRTPMQLVTLSNIKLNNDIYSARSLSIHRRVLVKNFLTLLYDSHPMLDYWFDDDAYQEGVGVGAGEGAPGGQCARGHEGSMPEPLLGEDEQNGWIEQTLNAAGLNDDDDDVAGSHRHHQTTKDEQTAGGNNNSTHGTSNKAPYTSTRFARSSASLPSPPPPPQPSSPPSPPSPPLPAQAQTDANARPQPPPSPHSFVSFPTPIPRAPRSSSSPNSPSRLSLSTSRPKSAELPQFLNSYLSAVFDVDWSVGLPSTEDSLFIQSSLTSSPPVASSLSSPKRISDSSASVSSFSSRSSTASLSSSMTSIESGSQKSVEEQPSKGRLWDENGSIPIPLLSKPATPSNANTSSNKKSHVGKSILVKRNQPTANNAAGRETSAKDPLNKGEVAKKSLPSLPAPILKQNIKPKAKLVPGRRSSLMQTGQIPTTSPPNIIKSPQLPDSSTSRTVTPAIEVTAPAITAPPLPPIPSTTMFPAGNTLESANDTSQTSPAFARRTSSLASERTGYQHRKALSTETLITPSHGLPRPLNSSGSPAAATLAASPPSRGITTIALSSFPSAPTSPPPALRGGASDGTVAVKTTKAGRTSPEEKKQPLEQYPRKMTYNSYVIHTAPIVTPAPPSLPYPEPAGFPPSSSRSPPQAPRQLAIGSSCVNGPTNQSLPSTSPASRSQSHLLRSPSRSQHSPNLAPTLPPLFPIPPKHVQSFGSGAYASSPISLDGYRQEHQKSQQTLQPPYTFARSVSDDEIQSRTYNSSPPTFSPPLNTRPAAGYSFKTSRSSPDLMSSSEDFGYGNSGGPPPMPSTPQHHQHQNQHNQQYQQGHATQYPGSLSRATSLRKPVTTFVSAPLPEIPNFNGHTHSYGHEEHRNVHHRGHGYSNKGSVPSIANTKWNSMKSMLGLRTGSGKA